MTQKIKVILRTCSNSLLQNNINETGVVRFCGANRQEMIYKCIISLITTINNSVHDIEFIILDDNSDIEFLNKLTELLTICKSPTSIISLKERGFNHSAAKQFEQAAFSDNYVYMVEDDYLHTPDAIDVMMVAHNQMENMFGGNVVIFPFDCPFRYETKNIEPTILYHDGVRYWRQVNRTSSTILTRAITIQQHYTTFNTLAQNYPKVLEDHTINTIYKTIPPKYNQNVWAFSPIPSLAHHLSYQHPFEITTPYLSWKQLWEQYEVI